jgi:uncharacterized membrane protein (Fun14 family)
MGVAPYKWPHQREWEPGIYDTRANRGLIFVMVLFAIFLIGFVLDLIMAEALNRFTSIVVLLVGVLVLILVVYLLSRYLRKDISVEELKYFEIEVDRLSTVITRMLDADGIARVTEGPGRKGDDDWYERFDLLSQPWSGISITIERNPLIARVDLSSITLRCHLRSMEHLRKLQDRIDSIGMTEMLDSYEQNVTGEDPVLVVYDQQGGHLRDQEHQRDPKTP